MKNKLTSDDKTKLYCDNPQCKSAILEEPLAYDKGNQEIYHDGHCALFANAYRAFKEGRTVFSNVDYITLDKAMDLFKRGELKQKSGLEEKLE